MRKFPRHAASLAALLSALVAVPLVHAVSLNPHGTGQVLIYPYYTVNGGQSTLLSLVNTTDRGKALKLRFREGYNGREVAGFNLYLAPYDVWTGVVFALSEGGDANLLTDDRSCTVPALRYSTTLPALGDGRRYEPFFYDYSVDTSAPHALARTREGSLEVIEMGEVAQGSPSLVAMTDLDGMPVDCGSLVHAWDSGGYWLTAPGTDITRPGGGLYGTLAVVNPAQGTIFEVAATALAGFSAYAQHSAPGNAHPDLGDARSSAIDAQTPYADADVEVKGTMLHLRYAGADRTVDAVSAALMANVVFGEWVHESQNVANTDLLFTFPTKRHYVDPAVLAQTTGQTVALPPFVETFGQARPNESCVEHRILYFDREADTPAGLYEPGYGPNQRYPSTCTQTAVLIPTSATQSVLHSSLLGYGNPAMDSKGGHLFLEFDRGIEPHVLRPATDGTELRGLPVIGFQVVNYQGSNVVPDVMANYSATVPLRSAWCSFMTGACP